MAQIIVFLLGCQNKTMPNFLCRQKGHTSQPHEMAAIHQIVTPETLDPSMCTRAGTAWQDRSIDKIKAGGGAGSGAKLVGIENEQARRVQVAILVLGKTAGCMT